MVGLIYPYSPCVGWPWVHYYHIYMYTKLSMIFGGASWLFHTVIKGFSFCSVIKSFQQMNQIVWRVVKELAKNCRFLVSSFLFLFFLEKIGYQFSDFVRTVGIRYSWVAFLICTQHTGTFTSLLSEAGWWLIQGSCFQCWVVLFVSKKQTQWWVMVYRLLTRGSDKIKEPVLTP